MIDSPNNARKERIVKLSKALRVPDLANYEDLVTDGASFEENYEVVLERTHQVRQAKSLPRRIGLANLDPTKNFDTFDMAWECLSGVAPDDIERMKNCSFIKDKDDIVLIGPVGRGKTHLAMAIGIEALKKGYRVLFNVADRLLTTLREARDERTLNRHIEALEKCDLFILDEIGYFSYGPEESTMLFRVVSSRHEKGSTIVTTNCHFSEWKNFVGDTKLLGAMVDRLTENSIILNMNSPQSYRLRRAKSRADGRLSGLDKA